MAKTIYRLLLLVGLSVLGLHFTLQALFPTHIVLAWVITALGAAIVFLLILSNFARTYHDRIVSEARNDWLEQVPILKGLSEYIARGETLVERCQRGDTQHDTRLEQELIDWHKGVASDLVYTLKLLEEYKDRFYKHSDSSESAPPVEWCYGWIHKRVAILKEIRNEFQKPPTHLGSHEEKIQIRSVVVLGG